MRPFRSHFKIWRVLIPVVIAADLLALWVWATRPTRVYDWLGLVGRPEDAPIRRLAAWLRWENGPRTPSGCASLFEADELVYAGMLLFALFLLIVPRLMSRSGGRLGLQLTSPASLARAVSIRFGMRSALAAVAVLGLYMGWEIDAWKVWLLRSSYRIKAANVKNQENNYGSQLTMRRQQLASIEAERLRPAYEPYGPGYYRTKAARAAELAVSRDRLVRETSYLSAMLANSTELKLKYQRAAANPREAVAPDPPLPKQEPDASDVLRGIDRGNYRRELAAYDELIRAYPDYVEPHLEAARVRATCPDARYRDGRRAAASATRACELTDWKDAWSLECLAAAHAEAGDFEAAVTWEGKALALTTYEPFAKKCRERLALYSEGQPYRQK